MDFIIAYKDACNDQTSCSLLSMEGSKEKHTHTAVLLNAPLSRDGISDICGHMIR